MKFSEYPQKKRVSIQDEILLKSSGEIIRTPLEFLTDLNKVTCFQLNDFSEGTIGTVRLSLPLPPRDSIDYLYTYGIEIYGVIGVKPDIDLNVVLGMMDEEEYIPLMEKQYLAMANSKAQYIPIHVKYPMDFSLATPIDIFYKIYRKNGNGWADIVNDQRRTYLTRWGLYGIVYRDITYNPAL